MCPQKIALLTDSCADLAPAVAEENHIYIVPLRILCADGELFRRRGIVARIFIAAPGLGTAP